MSEAWRVRKLRVRLRKEASAFAYAVFEAHEGVISPTTLPHRVGDPHRDLELTIPAGLWDDAARILDGLGDQIESREEVPVESVGEVKPT